jgi:hypothetical protein
MEQRQSPVQLSHWQVATPVPYQGAQELAETADKSKLNQLAAQRAVVPVSPDAAPDHGVPALHFGASLSFCHP